LATLLLGSLNALAQDNAAKDDLPPNSAWRLTSGSSEEIAIACGANRLAGVLHLPKGGGPHPAIIFIHGDGASDRANGGYYQPLWERFVGLGFACLSWDKPGVGKSTTPSGRYAPQSYYQRASELRRALDFLKGRRDIDSKRIGCWGVSQAGWIMPMVASRSGDIAFLIAISCPGQTAVVQSEYLFRCQALDEGASVKEADQAAAGYRSVAKLFPAGRSPSAAFWKHLEGTNPQYEDEFTDGPLRDGSMFIDPIPLLERTTCPVLAIFGAKDRNVDAAASAQVYKKALQQAGNRDVTIKTFADADHAIF